MKRSVGLLVLLAACLLLAGNCPSVLAKKNKTSTPQSFNHEGIVYTIHHSPEGRAFYYNTQTGAAQWEDPRTEALTGKEKAIAVLLFLSPFFLVFSLGGAYVFHIYRTKPELLKPAKKAAKGRSGKSLATSKAKADDIAVAKKTD